MKKWILCVSKKNALFNSKEGMNVEINTETNLRNLENIEKGDLVFVYFHEENTNKFYEEDDISIILEKIGYEDSKTGITHFKVLRNFNQN